MEPQPDPTPASGAARESVLTDFSPPSAPPERDRIWLHVGLFLATFASMVFIAAVTIRDVNGDAIVASFIGREAFYDLNGWTARLWDGLLYAVPFLLFLTFHEFGHYIAARRHHIRVSLPYYIPLPFAFGTFGAVIRIKEPIRRTRQLFDIGASGPLAGFVIAFGVLLIAVLQLPSIEYLLGVGNLPHRVTVQQFLETGSFPSRETTAAMGGAMIFGDTPLFHSLMSLGSYRVPGSEIMHYPMLLAGWLGLFFTALNLLPVGQLDGGHIIYSMFGEAVHRVVARVTTLLLLLSGSIGWLVEAVPQMQADWGTNGLIGGWAALAFLMLIYMRRFFEGDVRYALAGMPVLLALAWAVIWITPDLAESIGYTGWLLWTGLILFLIRMDHPPVLIQEPLTPIRRALGWACIVIFLLCFSIQPIVLV